MKSIIARVLIASLLGGVAVEVSACGEEEAPERPVDPRIARTKPVEVFHLLGFRRRRWEDGKLVFTRRNEGTPRVL